MQIRNTSDLGKARWMLVLQPNSRDIIFQGPCSFQIRRDRKRKKIFSLNNEGIDVDLLEGEPLDGVDLGLGRVYFFENESDAVLFLTTTP